MNVSLDRNSLYLISADVNTHVEFSKGLFRRRWFLGELSINLLDHIQILSHILHPDSFSLIRAEGTLLSRRANVCVQISNGFRGSGVDQPHADRQTRAGADPQSPHPVKRTDSAQSGQEELLHHQVAQSLTLSVLISNLFDLNGPFGKVGNRTSAGSLRRHGWTDILVILVFFFFLY